MIYLNGPRARQRFYRNPGYSSRFFQDRTSRASLFQWRLVPRLAPSILPGRRNGGEVSPPLEMRTAVSALPAAKAKFFNHEKKYEHLSFENPSPHTKNALSIRKIFKYNQGLQSLLPYPISSSRSSMMQRLPLWISMPPKGLEIEVAADFPSSGSIFNKPTVHKGFADSSHLTGRSGERRSDTRILHDKFFPADHALDSTGKPGKNHNYTKINGIKSEKPLRISPLFIKGGSFSIFGRGGNSIRPSNSVGITQSHAKPEPRQPPSYHGGSPAADTNSSAKKNLEVPVDPDDEALSHDNTIADKYYKYKNIYRNFTSNNEYGSASFKPHKTSNISTLVRPGNGWAPRPMAYNSPGDHKSKDLDDFRAASKGLPEQRDEGENPASGNFSVAGEVWLDAISLQYWMMEYLGIVLTQGGVKARTENML